MSVSALSRCVDTPSPNRKRLHLEVPLQRPSPKTDAIGRRSIRLSVHKLYGRRYEVSTPRPEARCAEYRYVFRPAWRPKEGHFPGCHVANHLAAESFRRERVPLFARTL